MDSEIWPWVSFALIFAVAALVLLLLLEHERKKPISEETEQLAGEKTQAGLPFSAGRSITADMFKEARDKLRILDLEREILSYALRRLYEASAEGKITEKERDMLALRYKEDLARIKEEIARGESIVALNELERMQEEFVKLFSERFEELSKRISELRALSGFAAPKAEGPEELVEREEKEGLLEEEKEEAVEAPKEPAEKEARLEKKVSKPKPPAEPEKTGAEKRIEQIVAEVEKVLKKLGQMEVEE